MGRGPSLNEPVKQTCPTINLIKAFLEDLKDLDGVDQSELNWQLRALEEVRDANDQLRRWGNELVDEINRLESEIKD